VNKRAYDYSVSSSLLRDILHAKQLWKQMRKVNAKHVMYCSISADVWVQHFQIIFAVSVDTVVQETNCTRPIVKMCVFI